MDLGYLKIKIDIKAEYEDFKKKYHYKRKELKKEEIKKVFDGFKDFFKSDGHFKFKENDHTITAEYKDYGITLDVDIYKNTDSPDFTVLGSIKTYEGELFDFTAEGISNKEVPLQPAFADEQERMIHDTRYFKDFLLNGDVTYSFQYAIKGREEVYMSMQEMMLAL